MMCKQDHVPSGENLCPCLLTTSCSSSTSFITSCLTLTFLYSSCKDPCYYVGPPWIIQTDLPSLVPKLNHLCKDFLLCQETYSEVLGIRMWTYLGADTQSTTPFYSCPESKSLYYRQVLNESTTEWEIMQPKRTSQISLQESFWSWNSLEAFQDIKSMKYCSFSVLPPLRRMNSISKAIQDFENILVFKPISQVK